MDSSYKSGSPSSNLVFLFLLFCTNLFAVFISTTFYFSSCTLNSQIDTVTDIPTNNVNQNAAVTDQQAPVDHKVQASDESEANSELPSELQFSHLHRNSYLASIAIWVQIESILQLVMNAPSFLMNFATPYKVNGACPDDELLAQKLLLKGCEPLPCCRCHPASPEDYVEPYPLPDSLWTVPSDSSVVWTTYTCKNYLCLINCKHDQKGFDDCKACFDLGDRERD